MSLVRISNSCKILSSRYCYICSTKGLTVKFPSMHRRLRDTRTCGRRDWVKRPNAATRAWLGHDVCGAIFSTRDICFFLVLRLWSPPRLLNLNRRKAWRLDHDAWRGGPGISHELLTDTHVSESVDCRPRTSPDRDKRADPWAFEERLMGTGIWKHVGVARSLYAESGKTFSLMLGDLPCFWYKMALPLQASRTTSLFVSLSSFHLSTADHRCCLSSLVGLLSQLSPPSDADSFWTITVSAMFP